MNEIMMLKKFSKSYEIKMSPDGKFLSHFNSTSVSVFDLENYVQIADFRDVKYPSHLSYSHDSKLLAVKSNPRKIAIYDLEKLKLIKLYRLKKNSQPQDNGLCFTNDNKHILNLVYTNESLGYISKIDIETFEEQRFFEECDYVFNYIQYVNERRQYLISGFDRNKQGDRDICFIMWYSEIDDSFERIDLDIQIHQILYLAVTNTFVGWSLSGKELTIISDTNAVKNKIGKISAAAETASRSNVIDNSKGLKKLLGQYQLDNGSLNLKLDRHRVVGPFEEDYISHICFSNNNKYLAVVLSEVVKIYEYPTLKFLNSITNKYSCYAEFVTDDKHLLIGTWSNGYLYKLNF